MGEGGRGPAEGKNVVDLCLKMLVSVSDADFMFLLVGLGI